MTATGEHRPIRWLGRRAFDCRGNPDLLPVRITEQAFGEGRPARDLFVSPAHTVAVNVLGEVLIPACRFINGTTITQAEVETVTYWHVELDIDIQASQLEPYRKTAMATSAVGRSYTTHRDTTRKVRFRIKGSGLFTTLLGPSERLISGSGAKGQQSSSVEICRSAF